MELAIHILLVVAGVLLLGNGTLSLWAARKVRQFQDNWLLSPLAQRWGATRIRALLIINGLIAGLVGAAAVTLGVCGLANVSCAALVG